MSPNQNGPAGVKSIPPLLLLLLRVYITNDQRVFVFQQKTVIRPSQPHILKKNEHTGTPTRDDVAAAEKLYSSRCHNTMIVHHLPI